MLIPTTLGLLIATAIGVYIVAWRGGTTSNGLSFREALLFLAINLAVAGVAMLLGNVIGIGSRAPNNRIPVPGSRYAPGGQLPATIADGAAI